MTLNASDLAQSMLCIVKIYLLCMIQWVCSIIILTKFVVILKFVARVPNNLPASFVLTKIITPSACMRERVIVVTLSFCQSFIKCTWRQLTFKPLQWISTWSKQQVLKSVSFAFFLFLALLPKKKTVSDRALIQPHPTLGPCKLTWGVMIPLYLYPPCLASGNSRDVPSSPSAS